MASRSTPSAAPVACTIVANNYLAYARVLARSFQALHPGGEMHVLIVDRPDPGLDYAAEPFRVTFVDELGIPGFAHMAFRYSILELSTAVKADFLRFLHQRHGARAVLYFDPDILITGALDELWSLLDEHDVVLTPHITAPIEDDATPGERDFLLSGMYNLGFLGIACNEHTLPFLDWWARRLRQQCLHAVERGLFVDQRWMDFAPSFLGRTCVLRDPGYNVAYWNLAHRRLARDEDGRWRVGERPLRFFHFSGLVLDRRELLSRFQNRFAPGERPDVQPLFDDYRERLDAARHRELSRRPYGFGAFDDGVAIPALARRLLQQVDPAGQRWPDPFRTGGRDSFRSWLTTGDDADDPVVLPRLATALWDERADLRRVFPTLHDASRRAFAYWLTSQSELAPEWLEPTAASLRPVAGTGEHRLEEAQRLVWHWLADAGVIPVEQLDAPALAALNEEVAPDPGRKGPRFTRLGLILHRLRQDLSLAYPDPAGRDRLAFAVWFTSSARLEYALPWSLVRPVLLSLPPRQMAWACAWWARHVTRLYRQRRRARAAQPPSLSPLVTVATADARPATTRGPFGVNVVGWIAAPTGVGEACRGTVRALAASDVPHTVWPLGDGVSWREAPGGAPYDVTLMHVNADMTETVVEELPRWVTAGRHRVGYWFWELSHFPLALAGAFRHVDEVWAPTRFCLDAFLPLATVPVRWVPPAVSPPAALPRSRASLGVPERSFLLLFAFDARSVPERKNPRALIEALRIAIAGEPTPLHLLLKVNHADECSGLLRELRERAHGLPVTLLTEASTRAEVDGLIAACDAYVSMHRSEGLGLPLIEAMLLGKPVVAPAYGGCTDFLDEQTGWPVRHRLVALDRAHGPYPPGAVWADPDPEHAAEQILRLLHEPELRQQRVLAAGRRVRELYAPEVAGARLRRELERILDSRDPSRTEAPPRVLAVPG